MTIKENGLLYGILLYQLQEVTFYYAETKWTTPDDNPHFLPAFSKELLFIFVYSDLKRQIFTMDSIKMTKNGLLIYMYDKKYVG